MYTLYYHPGSASMVVHLALLEIGAPYRLERLELPIDPQRDAAYLALNPRGQVPTLLIDGKPYVESSALLMALADRHPEAKLAPPPGSDLRPAYYQWMVFLATQLGAHYRLWFMPRDLGAAELPPIVRDALRSRIEQGLSILDAHIAAGGPCLLGPSLSMADLLALMYMRWSRNMPRPATEWPALQAYASRLRARPTWQRLYEIEGLTDWVG